MKLSALLTLALIAVPAAPAAAAAPTTGPTATGPTATPAATAPVTTGPTTVARYSFDRGIAASGLIAENSGRGIPLRVRTLDGGTVRVLNDGTGDRYVGFPTGCAPATTPCPRALLEGGDDTDLDPGTRSFRFGASILARKSPTRKSSNVLQKGVAGTESQWKMQLGAAGGPQCALAGRGATRTYLARSTVPVTDGKWHRLLCVRTATALHVFVDGVHRGRVTVPAALTISNSLPLRVGAPNLNPASDSFNGYLDDVFVAVG